MPRPQPQPNKLHDELDALLDGRPVELTVELAPLVEAADGLRAELAAFELDPEVAARHLERVLEGSGTVVRMPLRPQPNSWDVRRRVAAVVLAAALVLAPATMASAAALPGQPMYPFKLAIEQLRLASVQWSPEREAAERTRVADTRLDELERLVAMKQYSQVPVAIGALADAVAAAREAVSEAVKDGAPMAKVAQKLAAVNNVGRNLVNGVVSVVDDAPLLSSATRNAIMVAADRSQPVLLPPEPASPDRDPTSIGPGTSSTAPEPPDQEQSDPPPSSPPSDPEPSDPPPSSATPTTEGPTTTAPTTPSSDPDPPTTPDPGSPSGPGLDDAAGGRTQHGSEAPPTTTGP